MTSAPSLSQSIQTAPRVFDAAASARLREAWGPAWSDLTDAEADLLSGVAGGSPYLRRLASEAPGRVIDLLRTPMNERFAALLAQVREAGRAESVDDALAPFREAKQQAALFIALCDVAGAVDCMEAAARNSDFADAAVDAALRVAARAAGVAADVGNGALSGGADNVSGVASLAMGKLGGRELNYSSDIDLVIIFDAARMGAPNPSAAKDAAVRMARNAVSILQRQTADGYVFRTDLRLRPDPGVTALAISANAAETYYESYGQNWERMAYIKARAHAGDIALGEQFLKNLRPFVWRTLLDFAAIEDVMAVKRQLHSSKGGATLEFAGHDLKTGRGGIREIEFFVQTQQLIHGGKDPDLRQRGTLAALSRLCDIGRVRPQARDALERAYRYLRHVEHRLQMINDEQTHKIPRARADIERAAAFCGEANAAAFEEKILTHLRVVTRHFDALFHEDASDVAQPGPLVFTGVEGDAATLETLRKLGFDRGREISRAIRRWHTGAIRATRSERARTILTRLMAPLLNALARSDDPDAAFFAFDDFLTRLPGGVQVFSLLANNVRLFDDLVRIIAISPFLGRELSRRVNFVESLLTHGVDAPLPPTSAYGPSLEAAISAAETYEDALNDVRRWAGEAKFFVSAKLAVDVVDARAAARHYTAIAEASIAALLPVVVRQARGEGVQDPLRHCVLALGRFGAGDMSAASDVDLMFIYDAPASQSGVYARFVRRFVTALSAATEEGALYEVDMALRPSGSAGPVAVSLDAFRRYYKDDAWTWEIMALTKARSVAGDAVLSAAVDAEIDAVIRRPREARAVAADVVDMRQRLLAAKPATSLWDVKHTIGGATDVDFICQYLALVNGAQHGRAPRNSRNAARFFAEIGALAPDAADDLINAHDLYNRVFHAARAVAGDAFQPSSRCDLLAERMARSVGAATLADAERRLADAHERVADLYRQVVGPHSSRSG